MASLTKFSTSPSSGNLPSSDFEKSSLSVALISNIPPPEGIIISSDIVEDVLVIYCAKHPAHNFTTVVGWYNHATVYRYYQQMHFPSDNPEDTELFVQNYNSIAKAKDCILLPRRERSLFNKWSVPRRNSGAAYGFGQSNIWFAQEDSELLKKYIDQLLKQIKEYGGDNWLYEYPILP